MLFCRCNTGKSISKELSFSTCNFPAEFTCNSGTCVDIFKRCDNRKDCSDGSDETDCSMLRLSESYDKSLPPLKPDDAAEANDIYTMIEIVNVDFVDTVKMVVGLTIDIVLKWNDFKIDFENVKDRRNEEIARKLIPESDRSSIWLPMSKLVHDNAILGETRVEDFFNLEVEVKSEAMQMDLSEPRETLVYSGKESQLVMKQRFKLKYRCDFFVKLFPFDNSTCDFILSIARIGNNSIKMKNDDLSVLYDGPLTLNEFEITGHTSSTFHTDRKTSFVYTFHFHRLYVQHILTTFFQTFLLLFLAYITLFIDIDDFSNRFMGSVTSLLVLAALIASIGENLPKTAYFKYIDLWFNWFIINIFMIIVIHVVVDHLYKQNSKVHPKSPVSDPTLENWNISEKEKSVNSACKVIIPFLTLIFMFVYFFMSSPK